MATYQLYLGDCLEYMKSMPGGSVDAVITDPPYGIGESNKKNLQRRKLASPIDYGEFSWDNEPASEETINSCLRVACSQIIWGGNYFHLPPSRCWLVWDKHQSGDFADCELAWTSFSSAVRKFDYTWNGMIKKRPETRYHPTQKPLALMRWCIENYTHVGDTIFDPFMGSGTTGVAALQLGRNFIGCEIDPGYFEIAKRRIEAASLQPLLFTAGRQETPAEQLELV